MPVRDLTHPLSPSAWTYPGDPSISVESHASIEADGYRVSSLSFGSHAGTHLDAPSHTEPDGATVDELAVGAFEFDAMLGRVDAGAGQAIRPEELPSLPADVDCLVIHTGWSVHWGTERYLEHPFLAASTAARLADRGVSVGIDAPSVDSSSDAAADVGLPAHHALLGAGHRIVENLTGLDGLPDRFTLRAYPLPVVGGDGSPVRAVATF